MWTLAAETSTSCGSLALFKDAELFDLVDWPSERSHSEKITSECDALLKRNKLQFSDIDRYAVSTGPGSFTGIRVALNFVRALAYTFNRPVVHVDSLYLLATPALDQGHEILCFQSAFRNLIYCSHYKKNGAKIEVLLQPCALTTDETKGLLNAKTLVLGRALEAFRPVLDLGFLQFCERNDAFSDLPHARNFGPILRDFGGLNDTLAQKSSWIDTKPLYIRASEAEEKLRQTLGK